MSLSLAGCLEYEEEYLFIDIPKKVGEVRYSNIVSDSKDEKTIKGDFQDLIDMVYIDKYENSKEGAEQKTIQIISRELYGIGPRLDGTVNFSFKDLKAALNEFNIRIDKNEDYIYEMGDDEVYRGGNGTYSEHDSIKAVKWKKQSKTIELEKRTASFAKTKTTSLLSYWLDWKKPR
jgi:pSer/pThr/pTyr-binding forkhead associated (FHA) protein